MTTGCSSATARRRGKTSAAKIDVHGRSGRSRSFAVDGPTMNHTTRRWWGIAFAALTLWGVVQGADVPSADPRRFVTSRPALPSSSSAGL
jgi:hypothetical protein